MLIHQATGLSVCLSVRAGPSLARSLPLSLSLNCLSREINDRQHRKAVWPVGRLGSLRGDRGNEGRGRTQPSCLHALNFFLSFCPSVIACLLRRDCFCICVSRQGGRLLHSLFSSSELFRAMCSRRSKDEATAIQFLKKHFLSHSLILCTLFSFLLSLCSSPRSSSLRGRAKRQVGKQSEGACCGLVAWSQLCIACLLSSFTDDHCQTDAMKAVSLLN